MTLPLYFPMDDALIRQAIADGWTALSLWSANTPDGAYTNTNAIPEPATLADMLAAQDYTAMFTPVNANAAQWFKVLFKNDVSYSDLHSPPPFHGGGGTTRAVLRQRLGNAIGDMTRAVTTGDGTTGTAVVNNVELTRRPDGYFTNQFLHRLPGVSGGDDDWTQITGWDRSTKMLTLDPALGSPVLAGTELEITSRWTVPQYNEAINWAIMAVYPDLSRTIVTTALRTQPGVFEYQLPGDIKSVRSVEAEALPNAGDDEARHWIDQPFYVRQEDLTQFIGLRIAPSDSQRLRITGTGTLSQMHSDLDYVEVVDPQAELVIQMAANRLFTILPNDAAASDIDRYQNQAKGYLAMYGAYRGQWSNPKPARRLWSPQAQYSNNQLGYARDTRLRW